MERERELTPEERFTELVAVREKEKELKRRLEEAQARAQGILGQARERAALLRAQAAQELQRELEQLRARERAALEAEIEKILSEGRAAAQRAYARATEKLVPLAERLRRQLLGE
jgi:vacuolar-type H+-ATPase subunit H